MYPQSIVILGLLGLSLCGATVGETDRFIPLIHDGGGWTTQITIVNLSDEQALVVTSLITAKGANETWPLLLKATQGKVSRNNVESILPPGALTVIETSGTPDQLTRGFADVIEFQDLPIGAFARLIKRDKGQIVQSFTVPILPAHESKSILPLDLSDPAVDLEIALVSPTYSTTLAINFRKDTGEIAFSDYLSFDGRSQIFVKPLELWPQLKDFRGTMEWKVSFPNADRYEYRYLSSVAIWGSGGQAWAASPVMTLKADQLNVRPY